MALPIFTDRPTSSTLGSVATIVGGAGSAHAATSDSNTATAVRVAATARLDSEKCSLGFTTPASLPAGARILSVGIRRTVQTIPTGDIAPTCFHWHRSLVPADPTNPLGSVATPFRDPFQSNLEKADPAAWFTESLGDRRVTPDGTPWDLTTNLVTFFYDFGADFQPGADPLLVAEVWRDVTYQRISTVAVVGPSGTVSATRPTVTGSYASPDSQPIEAFQVAIYKQADTLVGGFVPFVNAPLQQSGWILSEDIQWQLTGDLVDGVYVIYIQGRASWAGPGDFVTAVASGTFTRAASGTVAPNATLQSVTFDPVRNRNAITMLPSSASPATAAYTVVASRDGGQSFQPRPSLTLIPATGMTPVTVYDRFFDVGVTMQYKVLSYASTTPNASPAYSNTISVATYGDSWWIRHPENDLLDTKVLLAAEDGYVITRTRVMGTHAVISRNGRVNKVVTYGSTYGDEGVAKLLFNADEATLYSWDSYSQLDISNMVLFVQEPDGTSQWWALGPGTSGQDTKLEHVPMPGAPGYLQRRLTTGFTQQDPPSFY